MESKDMDRHIGELWKKAAGTYYVPEAAVLPDEVRQSGMETLRFLREKFSKAEGEWRALIAAKDAQLRDLYAQLEAAGAQLDEAREDCRDAREEVINEELASALRLEGSVKALDAQKKNHRRELAAAEASLERAASEIAGLRKRVDVLRLERDEALGNAAAAEAVKAELAAAARGRDDLAAKLAVSAEELEKVRAELTGERDNRISDQARIQDLEARLEGLAAGQQSVKAGSEAPEPKAPEEMERGAVPAVTCAPAAAVKKTGGGFRRAVVLGLAGLVFAGGAAWQFHRWRAGAHYTLLASVPVNLTSPSGLAATKYGVWLSDLAGGLELRDAGDLAVRRSLPAAAGALSAADGGLWTLDADRVNYTRRDYKDGSALETLKAPGNSPQGAAWDGYSLWAFDSGTGLIYNYPRAPKSGSAASYRLEGLKSLVCMQWYGGALWTLDSKSALRRYSFEDGAFREVSRQAFGGGRAAAFCIDGDTLWSVEKTGLPAGGFELKKYSLELYS